MTGSRPSSSLVWLGLAPPRVETFYWLAVSSRVSTADIIRRRGMVPESISVMCLLCNKEWEKIDHLFLCCEFSYSLWCPFLVKSGVGSCIPKSLGDLIEAWRFPFLWV